MSIPPIDGSTDDHLMNFSSSNISGMASSAIVVNLMHNLMSYNADLLNDLNNQALMQQEMQHIQAILAKIEELSHQLPAEARSALFPNLRDLELNTHHLFSGCASKNASGIAEAQKCILRDAEHIFNIFKAP